MKPSSRVISNDVGLNYKSRKIFTRMLAPYNQQPEKIYLQERFENMAEASIKKGQDIQGGAITQTGPITQTGAITGAKGTAQAGAITQAEVTAQAGAITQAEATAQSGATVQDGTTIANKCTCKIEEDIWDLDEANVILNACCFVCNIGINEGINSSAIKIENEVQPAEDDFEEITLDVNASTSATKIENEFQLAEDDFEEITLETNTSSRIKVENEIQSAEDGFEVITLGNCFTCNGPARVCNCPDANVQLPFDHERDDSGFVDDSPATMVQRKIRALDFEVDDIFDPMSDGCTEILRRISYDREPNERVDIHEVGYTFVDHHKKK